MKPGAPASADSTPRGYDDLYGTFDSPLMRRLRVEAYGEDIGQHSWVTAGELRADIPRLRLSPASRFLDLGCGPCGPLTFVVQAVGCAGIGTELSAAALAAGRARAASLGIDRLVTLLEADLNQPLPFPISSIDAAMALDVVLHLRDRGELLREVARILVPGGRCLFTDAGVVTGAISTDEIVQRSVHGHTQFAPAGFNERVLDQAGFRVLETEDRTASVLRNAEGRRAARLAHRAEVEQLEGATGFERQQQYLDTVIALARRGALSRIMYLAQARAD